MLQQIDKIIHSIIQKTTKINPFLFNNNNYNENIRLKSLINYNSNRYGRRYRRWYHWPNDFLPFHWEREKLDPPYLRTGDAVRDIGRWDPNDLIPGAEYSNVLKDAPEIVRRQFSLGFAERSTVVKFQMEKILKQVRRYPFDNMSPEVKIAQYTVKIRNNLHYFTKIDKYDAKRKIQQETLKNRRSSLLIDLYYQDRKRYNYIVTLLGIKHTIPNLGETYRKPTRKSEIHRLTDEYCEKIKDEKLNKYHDELKQKQQTLNDERLLIDKLIENDEKYLGIINDNKNGNDKDQLTTTTN